jgi:hypothetical protein
MPRKPFQIQAFHGGLNTKSDNRDISESQLANAVDISIDDLGMVTNAGIFTDMSVGGLTKPAILASSEGYGLFRFSSDYDDDYNGTATPVRTDYLLSWNDGDAKFYWSPDGANWASPGNLDSSTLWADAGAEVAKPTYYKVDGAIRISDTAFNAGNVSLWMGAINRTCFTSGATQDKKGWFLSKQELIGPSSGVLSKSVPADLAAIGNNRIYWQVRNIKEDATLITDFSESSGWRHSDVWGSGDNNGQVSSRQANGYDGASYFHRHGWRLQQEDNDDILLAYQYESPVFTNGTSITSGDAFYIAVRVEDIDNKNMWNGTHAKVSSADQSYAIEFSNPYIQFADNTMNITSRNWIRWKIDLFALQDVNPGEWVIIEVLYDDYDSAQTGVTSITPTVVTFGCDHQIQLTGDGSVSTNSTMTDTAYSVIHMSDLRFGDPEKTGTSGAKGIKNFAYSFLYDENDMSESLLYTFSDPLNLHPNSYGYKVGITAHIDKAILTNVNDRLTGANLYIIDEDVPYRVAQLDFLKGLKGAWEMEYASDKLGSTTNSFAAQFTTGNKSNTVTTTGLPLLESYEALHGFKASVNSITAKYKTAVVLNRKVYIGNIEQNGTVYGDRMIKSVTNSFDVFPSEGREIDVAINDGDDIIKLETYADRILQFKRNSMFLINATSASEYLEDTFIGKGVVHPGAVCKTDFGIAWVNENGCYIYDGRNVSNLTESLIKESEWNNHINSNSQIFYEPKKRKIFVNGDWTGSSTSTNDLYEYSLQTKGWTKLDNKAPTIKSNFIYDIDNIVKCVDGSGDVFKWDDSESTSASYQLVTRDIDFGTPGQDKRIYKVYVTYRCSNDTNVNVLYDVNGKTTLDKVFKTGDNYAESNLQGTGSQWAKAILIPNVSTECNKVRSFQLKFIANGTVPSNFSINDITIVYRERMLR